MALSRPISREARFRKCSEGINYGPDLKKITIVTAEVAHASGAEAAGSRKIFHPATDIAAGDGFRILTPVLRRSLLQSVSRRFAGGAKAKAAVDGFSSLR